MVQQNATALKHADALPMPADPAREIAQMPGFDHAGHALLREVRWRRYDGDRRGTRILLFGVLLLHLLAVFLVRELMHVRWPPEDRRDVLHINLIDIPDLPTPGPATLDLPTLRVDAPQRGISANAPAVQRPALAARLVAPPQPRAGDSDAVVEVQQLPKLYNADGSLRLVPAVPRNEESGPMAAGKAAARELATRGHNLVRCRPTRFASIYSPDESVGDEMARKYLAVVGMYNPHSATRAAERKADATAACDSEGF